MIKKILIIFLLFLLVPSSYYVVFAARGNDVIPYNGYITDIDGVAITDTVDIVFKIYTTSTGGSSVWNETHSSVSIDKGYFNVELGNQTTMSSLDFMANRYYLGVSVDGNSEMSPRQMMGDSPYALYSGVAGNLALECNDQQTIKFDTDTWVCGDDNDTNAGTSGDQFQINQDDSGPILKFVSGILKFFQGDGVTLQRIQVGEPSDTSDAVTKNYVDTEISNISTSTGSILLSGLTDVNLSSPSNNQFLIFNNSSGKWINETLSNLISYLVPSNNLSDLGDASTARTNLGLGTVATLASSAVLQVANNLSDLADVATARLNLGLGSLSTQDSIDVSDNTNLTVSNGVSLTDDDLSIDSTYTQRRVSSTCDAGSSIRVINEDGTVTCETDDSGSTIDSINDIADVNITTVSDGQVLSYDSGTSKWVNEALSSLISYLVPSNNLSDLGDASTARTNLGLGTVATLASSAVLQAANNLSDLASASTARTNLGLGTASTLASSAILQTANNLSDLASASTARTNLGVAIGNDVQAYDAGLASIAGLTTAADKMIYTTDSDAYAVGDLTSAGRAILDDADASAQRSTLGLGTAATLDTGISANNVLKLDSDGKLGIGVVAGSSRLTIGGETAQYPTQLYISPTAHATSRRTGLRLDDWMFLQDTSGNGTKDFSLYQSSTGLSRVTIDTSGGVYFRGNVSGSTNNTYSSGTSSIKWTAVYATNGTIQTSDVRLKKNIDNITYGLDEITQLRPVSYDWKDGSNDSKKLGLIAQEVQTILPEIVDVGSDNDHTLGINYSEFIPIIIKALQELNTKVVKVISDIRGMYDQLVILNNKIDAQQSTIETQQFMINELKDQIELIKRSSNLR